MLCIHQKGMDKVMSFELELNDIHATVFDYFIYFTNPCSGSGFVPLSKDKPV